MHPDGDTVAFTVNHRGTTELAEMSLTERHPRTLVRSRRFEQVYAPRYSPDGAWIAVSRWSDGRRDLWRYRRSDGHLEALTHDRAMDLSPVYSPDGRYLLWSSDRTGVMNLYARDLTTGEVRQVTNAVMGAFQPAVSPDGRSIAYVGYTPYGWDLYVMPFDPSRWREPEAPLEDFFDREGDTPPPIAPDHHAGQGTPQRGPSRPVALRVHDYDPWATMRPRGWLLEYGVDGFGPQLAVRALGGDVVGRHLVERGGARGPACAATPLRRDLRLPRDATDCACARTAPSTRARATRLGPQHAVGGRAHRRRERGERRVPGRVRRALGVASYEAQWVRALGGLPLYRQGINPNDPPPTVPFEAGSTGCACRGGYSRVQRYAYSISAQQGFSAFASVRVLDPPSGATWAASTSRTAVAGYFPCPGAAGGDDTSSRRGSAEGSP
ncbi:MAG: hypothetical protein R3A52_21285 [Polyangiales bacterium]